MIKYILRTIVCEPNTVGLGESQHSQTQQELAQASDTFRLDDQLCPTHKKADSPTTRTPTTSMCTPRTNFLPQVQHL